MAVRFLCALALALPGGTQDRAPEPDAAQQKDRLKVVRDLFKEGYAKKAPQDQAALARQMINRGLETQDDPAARIVLLKEARDLAAGAGDVETSLRACDEIARSFDVPPAPQKLAALAKAGGSGKDTEVGRAVARGYLALVAEAILGDDYESATTAAGKAEAFGKASQDAATSARAQDAQRDLPGLKSEYQKVKGSLDKASGTDPEGAGRYLCFVRGDWEAGLPLLASGAKAPLKTLAEKDAAAPVEAEKQLDVAEGWWELAQKEKSPWRKSKLAARAHEWFERAATGATGLTRVKLEKRLNEIEDSQPGVVNLLRLIDVKQDPLGDWLLEGGVLLSPPAPADPARVLVAYSPPDEYDLTAVVERRQGNDAILFGLARGTTLFAAWIDGFSQKGGRCGIEQVDGIFFEKNPPSGALLTNGKASTIVLSVRKTSVTGSIDGKSFVNYQGNTSRLGMAQAHWKVGAWKGLFVGSCGSQYAITKLLLTSVSGQGKKLR